jgi:hypothetical protein
MTTYAALSQRIQAAKTQQELAKREKQITRHYHMTITTSLTCTRAFGGFKVGQSIPATIETNSLGQTRVVIADNYMPPATVKPSLFFDNEGRPDGSPAWSRFSVA